MLITNEDEISWCKKHSSFSMQQRRDNQDGDLVCHIEQSHEPKQGNPSQPIVGVPLKKDRSCFSLRSALPL